MAPALSITIAPGVVGAEVPGKTPMTSAYASASVAPGVSTSANCTSVPTGDLMETLLRSGHFKRLIAAVKMSGLTSLFTAAGPYTVFAPNDFAFGKLAGEELADLFKLESKAKLTAILRLHLVPRRVRVAESDEKPAAYKSLHGQDLVVNTIGNLKVNNVQILGSEVQASNGVIFVVDTVLMPTAA